MNKSFELGRWIVIAFRWPRGGERINVIIAWGNVVYSKNMMRGIYLGIKLNISSEKKEKLPNKKTNNYDIIREDEIQQYHTRRRDTTMADSLQRTDTFERSRCVFPLWCDGAKKRRAWIINCFLSSTQDKYLMKKDERIICCYIREGRATSRRIRDIVLFWNELVWW